MGSGKPKVWNPSAGWIFGSCVCEVCATKSKAQYLLCVRQCGYADSICAQCFPSDATVAVQRPGGQVDDTPMERLQVGDRVLTQAGFSKIFAFMDHANDVKAEYVQLVAASGHELSITADHILYAHAGRTPVLAGSIAEGDLVWMAAPGDPEPMASRVLNVSRAVKNGMHAPLTEDGSVVVNGLLASSYAKIKTLRWGHRELVSGHTLGKLVHEPLRLACRAAPSLCGPGWHTAEGRHVWTQLLLSRFGWLLAMNDAHADLEEALVTQPSTDSFLAVVAQVTAALALSAIFGSGSWFLMMGVVTAARVMRRRSLEKKLQ